MDLGNCVIDTKSVTPSVLILELTLHSHHRVYPGHHGDLSEEGIRESLNRSLSALGKHKIRILYLHAPDPTVPIKTTLRAINDLYNEGHL